MVAFVVKTAGLITLSTSDGLFAMATSADRLAVGSRQSFPAARQEALKSFTWAAAWVAGALWFSLHLWHPLEDFRLMTGARTIQGEIVGTDVDVEDCDSGTDCTRGFVGYRFQPAGGADWHDGRAIFDGGLPREFQNLKLPAPIEIEYLPSDPTINRLKDTGSSSLGEWWFRFPLWLGFVCFFCWPGIVLLRRGLAKFHQQALFENEDTAL